MLKEQQKPVLERRIVLQEGYAKSLRLKSNLEKNLEYRRIVLKEGYAKSLRLKSNLEKDLPAAVHLSAAPSPPMYFVLGGQAIL